MVTDRQSSSISLFGSIRRKRAGKSNSINGPPATNTTATAISSPVPPSEAAAAMVSVSSCAAPTKTKRDWNDRGWIRIYCGPYRDVIDAEESSRMVNVAAKATAVQVARELGLPAEYALWMQTGGSTTRRLRPAEHPLVVQEEFCQRLGWTDASRRSRLAIDPQLKHLLRLFVGPAAAPTPSAALMATDGGGINGSGDVVQRSGTVELLKGLVSPQWRQRAVALVGSLLLVYPGNTTVNTAPDVLDLAQCEIIEHAPGYNRLILKIVPTSTSSAVGVVDRCCRMAVGAGTNNGDDDDDDDVGIDDGDSAELQLSDVDNNNVLTCGKSLVGDGHSHQHSCGTQLLHSSSWSLLGGSSGGCGDREKVLFIGFEESWERDLWSAWLIEASNHTTLLYDDNDETSPQDAHNRPSTTARCIDIAGSGLQAIPDVVLQSMQQADELRAGQNQLQAIGLRTIAELRRLRVLRLPGNGFTEFPGTLLTMQALRVLDLAANGIAALPADVWRLESLEELLLDRNGLRELPETLGRLKQLRTLNVSHNRIKQLPDFLLLGTAKMRKPINMQMLPEDHEHQNPPLTKVNLRSNQLRGSIILGNYGYLTQLDVSENDIEILDLSALDQLETLQCSRNKIKEITLNGRVLRSLVAGNNDLCRISVAPAPAVLTHLDLSHNKFTALPDWVPQCDQLHTLFASHNQIVQLPAGLFANPRTQLHSVHLDYNEIRTMPAMSGHPHYSHRHSPDPHAPSLPLHELRLHNNHIEALPDDFFVACQRLVILNVSSNRLQTLPIVPAASCQPGGVRLERLYVTSNRLCDNAYDTLTALGNLVTLHAAYNRLNVFPDQCALFWPRLEELCLSGNNLLYLPDSLAALQLLRTLRVHTNKLQSVPALSQTVTLRTLDLAHNQLDRINFVALVPRRLKFLDLSCNQQLQVDPRQLQLCRSQRPMSLVDVSGRNRASLPAVAAVHAQPPAPTPTMAMAVGAVAAYQEGAEYAPPWRIGFSETAGCAPGGRLFVAQLRLPCFCNNEGLFGLFDGESSRMQPAELVTAIPKILLDERTVKETAASYMRYTLLSAHRELRDKGQRQGVCALLCHVSVAHSGSANGDAESATARCRYVLRVASVGQAQAILIRRQTHVRLTPPQSTPLPHAQQPVSRQIGHSASYPDVLPDPEVCEIALNEHDEYLVLGNRRLWDVLTDAVIVREIRAEANVILAAKRLQDIAQSYGAADNLSLIIVNFANLSSNSDHLMRELRSKIVQKQTPAMATTVATGNAALMAGGGVGVVSGFCRCGCCCESNNNCCHSGASMQFVRHESQRSSGGGGGVGDDRSSPSGQSDITEMSGAPLATGDGALYQRKTAAALSCDGMASRRSAAHERRSMRNCAGIVRAVRARIEEENEVGGTAVGSVCTNNNGAESDSAMSEEQFKCWEYMLEQNTQLLFDKELNTISKGLTHKHRNHKTSIAGGGPLLPLKSLSLSSPQLAQARPNEAGDTMTPVGVGVGVASAADADGFDATEHRPAPHVAQYHASTPFLNRQFGSSRSFQPMPPPATAAAGLFKSLASGRLMAGVTDRLPQRPLGGPNAAYFGSLQRLMPYNLEYDFAAMRERMAVDESMEYDHRLQQYWGVATTEL